MKNKFYRLLTLGMLTFSGLLTGCGDFFNLDPENSLKEDDYYQSRGDLNGGALGMYAALAGEVDKFLLWGSARGDLVTTGEEGKDAYVTEFVNNRVTVLNPYTNYNGLYKVIARANRQLEHVGEVKKIDKGLTNNDANAFYAEAYFVRALCYFYLVRTFQEFPLVVSDLSENIQYMDEEGNVISQSTLDLTDEDLRAIALKPIEKQAVWKQIIQDLRSAMGLMPAAINWNGNALLENEKFGRVSLAGILSLTSEVMLWTGQYLKASAYVDIILSNNNYNVGDAVSWGNLFVNSYLAGADIFVLGYDYDKSHETNSLQRFTSNVAGDGGDYLVKPVKKIVDNLFLETGDVRVPYTYKRIDKQDLIWKYIGKNNEVAMRDPYKSTASWHIIRTADVILLKALAENRDGRPGGAIQFLNQVRKNRSLVEYDAKKLPSLDVNYIEDLILAERARELAFEGKRWYDLLLVSSVFGRPEVLPDAVARKYATEEKRQEMHQYLTNPSTWYLPIEPGRWN